MSGKNVKFNEYKHRWEKQKFMRILEDGEVRELIKKQSDTMEWNLYKCVYPVNPLEIDCHIVDNDVLKLLRQCAIVKASMQASVRDSVFDSVWALVS